MNLTISPINYNFKTKQPSKNNLAKQDNTISYNATKYYPAINPIYFCADYQKRDKTEVYQKVIDKYCLGISTQDFGYIFNHAKIPQDRYRKFSIKGDNIFNIYILQAIHAKYPNASKETIEKIFNKTKQSIDYQKLMLSLFPCDIFQFSGEIYNQIDSKRTLNGLLGMLSSQENFDTLGDFITLDLMPRISISEMPKENTALEALKIFIRQKGEDETKIYIQRKEFKDKAQYSVYYKDTLLSELSGKIDDETLKENAIKQAILALKNDEIDIKYAWDKIPFETYQKPNALRKQNLKELQLEYGLVFLDVNLLHSAFLCGKMQDDSVIPYEYSNEALIEIGKTIIKDCTSEYIKSNINEFARKMDLDYRFSMDTNKENHDKDFLNALVGAIFINGGAYGIGDVVDFFYENFYNKANPDKQSDISIKSNFPTESPQFTYIDDISRNELLKNTIEDYNLKLDTETLEYVFDRYSLQDKEFQQYATLGNAFFQLYIKTKLFEKYPLKPEGELTKIRDFIGKKFEPFIITELFDGDLFKHHDDTDETLYSKYFDALLGAIICADKEDGEYDCLDFLDDFVDEILDDYFPEVEQNSDEKFFEEFEKAGYNYDDLLIKIKQQGGGFVTFIYYQDRLIAPEFYSLNQFEAEKRAQGIILEKIKKDDIFANEIETSVPKDLRKAEGERKEKLEELCKRYDIEFEDLNLLNKALIYRMYNDNSTVSHQDGYQVLEFLGDAVLGYCTKKTLIDFYKNEDKGKIGLKFSKFTNNENLGRIAKKFGIDEYIENNTNVYNKKTRADLLEAIIGAIYLDGGFDEVFRFINHNLRAEILGL